ncbi:MAG: hypothetical protein QNJ20_07860 [Paracoccaceae bacterium]|nr:hypothetical protein [Paracoccaceae bacterium]
MMGGNLIWFLIVAVLVVVPFWKLLPRYGISPYFALLAVIPAIALVLLWIIAFKDEIDGRGA